MLDARRHLNRERCSRECKFQMRSVLSCNDVASDANTFEVAISGSEKFQECIDWALGRFCILQTIWPHDLLPFGAFAA